jgi:diaminopimelate decarboxylase
VRAPAIVATCPTPALVYDLARIEANLRAIAAAARAHGIVPLFAAKSFPHPAVWALAAEIVDGFDVASAGEAVPRAKVVSIADPTGRHADAPCDRLIVSCETPEQAMRAPPRADIAIRLSASITGTDPAIGAVQDGSGHRRSRFGLEASLRAIADAAGTRRVGLHVHHGSIVATSPERFVTTARAALALAADIAPAFLDLGGAWHAVDIAATFAALRAATDVELIVEPGRAYAAGAGFAVGTVTAARELADRPLRVLDLSRACHLRWSQPELIATPPAPRAGRAILWAGPTCYEDDVLGEWIADPRQFPAGARVVLGNVTGYALAWNTGFGGVPPAHVEIT